MTATAFIICRLRLPEQAFETLVTLPIYILGQLPQQHIQQIMGLYPNANVFQLLIPGGQVVEFKREQQQTEEKNGQKKSEDGVILHG